MIYIVFIIILFCIISLVDFLKIYYYGKKYIFSLEDLKECVDTVIIFGAGIRLDLRPCDILCDRLNVGTNVYLKNKCKKILLTGDNKDSSRNEVDTMKKYIISKFDYNKIEEHKILLDNNGFCTLNSIINAKENFNIKKAILCTNKYHLPRAIYVARKLGIESYGISSDLRKYELMNKYKKREILAQIKDFLVVNIIIIIKMFNKKKSR